MGKSCKAGPQCCAMLFIAVAVLALLAGCSGNKPSPAPLAYQGSIVDTHEHLQSTDQLDDMFAGMEANNIVSIWLMGRGDRFYKDTDRPELATLKGNNDLILDLADKYPHRIEAFPRIRPRREQDPLKAVDDLVARGAAGIKLHFGSNPPKPGRPYASDEPYLGLYKHCETKGILVMIHLEEHAQPGRIDRIAAACPDLKLIVCHVGHIPENPDLWDDLLTRHGNLYTEFSFGFEKTYADRAVKLSGHSARWREVVLAHPGRFLYGTDMVIGPGSNRTGEWIEGRFRIYRYMLELGRFHDTLVSTKRTYELDVEGLHLPQEVLRSIYWDNPRKLVAGF